MDGAGSSARSFPDQKLDNRPYRIFFASGDYTCSVARFTGTMTGPMKGPDGNDLVTFMKQIGLA